MFFKHLILGTESFGASRNSRMYANSVRHQVLLSKEQKQVTWKQDFGRVSANDKKVCVRHLELVKARIMARRAKTVQKIGRE